MVSAWDRVSAVPLGATATGWAGRSGGGRGGDGEDVEGAFDEQQRPAGVGGELG
jgi:hypothetical protein